MLCLNYLMSEDHLFSGLGTLEWFSRSQNLGLVVPKLTSLKLVVDMSYP